MIDWFKSLFGAKPASTHSDKQEQARIAATALLFEVMRVDGDHHEKEHKVLMDKLAQRWQLTGDAARQLLHEAQRKAHHAVDYHHMVKLLREHYDSKERIALVRDMWDVAHADNHVDPHEEHIIRKIADLLYVSHSDFIRAKLQR